MEKMQEYSTLQDWMEVS